MQGSYGTLSSSRIPKTVSNGNQPSRLTRSFLPQDVGPTCPQAHLHECYLAATFLCVSWFPGLHALQASTLPHNPSPKLIHAVVHPPSLPLLVFTHCPTGISHRTNPACAPAAPQQPPPVRRTENQEGSKEMGEMVNGVREPTECPFPVTRRWRRPRLSLSHCASGLPKARGLNKCCV